MNKPCLARLSTLHVTGYTISYHPMRSFILGFILTFSSGLQAQNCQCNLFLQNRETIELATENMDTAAIQAWYQQLQNAPEPFCQFLGISQEVQFLTRKRRFERLPGLLAQLEKRSQSIPCQASVVTDLARYKADYYQKLDSVELATQYVFEALALAEKAGDAEQIIAATTILSTIYYRQNQEIKAKPFILKALQRIEKQPESPKAAAHYNWLGRIYESDFALLENPKLLDSAETFANKALRLAGQFQLDRQKQQAFQIKEAIAYHRGEFQQSLSWLDSTYFYIKKAGDFDKIHIYFLTKASSLAEMGHFKSASAHQDSAIFYARKYSQPSFLANILKQAVEVFEMTGETGKALACLKESGALSDSLFTAARSKVINELEQKYQKVNDENTILNLSNQRKYLWIGLLSVALLAMIVYYQYRRRLFKQKQEILEIQQRLNRARMNPHFFFNALSSLQSFAVNETDSIALAENLSKFSHIMRQTLENTYRDYVTIKQEEDFLREYLELQQMRFPDKFDFTIHCDKNLDLDDLLVPSMIVQPFVENSVEHGFANISYKGLLKINFAQDDDGILVTVCDNGRGLNYNTSPAKPYVSRASQIIKDRIYLLNLKLKSNATFKIANNADQGVTITIKLPMIHES